MLTTAIDGIRLIKLGVISSLLTAGYLLHSTMADSPPFEQESKSSVVVNQGQIFRGSQISDSVKFKAQRVELNSEKGLKSKKSNSTSSFSLSQHQLEAQDLESYFKKLAHRSPLNAIQEIQALPSTVPKEVLMAMVLSIWMTNDPLAAMEWVSRSPKGVVLLDEFV